MSTPMAITRARDRDPAADSRLRESMEFGVTLEV